MLKTKGTQYLEPKLKLFITVKVDKSVEDSGVRTRAEISSKFGWVEKGNFLSSQCINSTFLDANYEGDYYCHENSVSHP